MPTKYIYHQTEYIKRPTVHTIVQNNYYSNDENPYLLRTPKIDKLTLSLSPQRNINNISQQNGKRFGGFISCDWKGNYLEAK